MSYREESDTTPTEYKRTPFLLPMLSITGVYLVAAAAIMTFTGFYAHEPVDKAQLKACETEVEALEQALQEVLREKLVAGESGFGG